MVLGGDVLLGAGKEVRAQRGKVEESVGRTMKGGL